MLTDLKDAFRRAAPTLAEDAAGVAALGFLLIAGLYLPSML